MKNIKSRFKLKHTLKAVFGFLGRNMKWIAFLFFFVSAAYCVYIWHEYVYAPEWSEERKKGYMESKDKAVTFSRPKFREMVENSKNRERIFGEELKSIRDIFGLER